MLIDEISERLKIWKEGGEAGPLRMELHPTDRCNLRCIFCWRVPNKNKNFTQMTERRLLKIPKEAAELGIKEWVVSGGGEPMMRKNSTLKVLKRIKEYNMWGLLTTNGTLLDENDAKFLVKIGWDQVQFSIDGPNKDINDFLRPPHSFERIIRSVKTLRKVRDSANAKKPYIGFNTILNRMNFGQTDEMLELASDVGSELVYFEPIYPGYSKIDLRIPKEKMKKLAKSIRKSEKTAKELGIATNAKEFLEVSLIDKSNLIEKILDENKNLSGFIGAPCFRPWYLMGIKASGFAGCCSTFENGQFIQGKSLKEVWFGKTFKRLREEVINKKMPSYCSKCSIVVLMENKTLRKMLI
jgi:MoaA/NifB/PqqE/SkfB family radical SAM enzyme